MISGRGVQESLKRVEINSEVKEMRIIPPEHVDVRTENPSDPGAERCCSHANVPHHSGEELSGEDVHRPIGRGDRQLSQH